MENKPRRTIFVFIIFLILSCSPTTRYKWASFFFDGVPNPDKKLAAKSDTISVAHDSSKISRRLKREQPQIILHPPYQEKSCDACHDIERSHRLLDRQPDLCYQCHEDFSDTYTALHGPVAAGYCTQCHNPHMSRTERLLKRKGQNLCTYCHTKAIVLKNDVHDGIEDTDCQECHNPHGGDDVYMLK